MSDRYDRGAVPREAFLAMKSWLDRVWTCNPQHPELSNTALGKNQKSVRDLLDALAMDPWPQDASSYKTFTIQVNEEDRYRAISRLTRKALAVACRELGFQYRAQTMKSKLEFRIAWGNTLASQNRSAKTSCNEDSQVTRVIWLRAPYPGSFSDLVLLGASTMAQHLGVNLEVHDLKPGESLVQKVRSLGNGGSKSGKGRKTFRNCSFVLELADAPEAALALNSTLSRCRVITTGVIGADISLEDTKIGMELAKSLIHGQHPGAAYKIVAVVPSDDMKPGRGHRVAAFKTCIEEAIKTDLTARHTFETVSIERTEYRHSHDLCLRLLNQKGAANLSNCDAIFTAAGEFAESLLNFFDVNPGRRPPKIFTADITPSLLNRMWEPDSTLEAMCGVEPFSYGRCIVRASCANGQNSPVQFPVVQFQRRKILQEGIRNYAQLLAEHPELLLNDARSK